MSRTLPLPTRSEDVQFSRLVESARNEDWQASDVARLAVHLAESGERLSWAPETPVADVASTGGPGSLSTLLAPLVLNAGGTQVVKLGVPGRPAGAIDSLATIPGYRARLTADEVRSVVAGCGFAHFLAEDRFAPLDAALFEYRRRVGAVAVPPLASASLLSKKVAVGVTTVGLDVRVGAHGNFGATQDEARQNAAIFCAAARDLGLEAVAFLSAGIAPSQPWIGRGEALVALAVAAGLHEVEDGHSWLRNHVGQCWRMADEIAKASGTEVPEEPIDVGPAEVRQALGAHLAAQGATIEAFRLRILGLAAASRETIHADNSGFLSLDLGIIRKVLVATQASSAVGVFTDPAGVELLVGHGQSVATGTALARVRCDGDRAATQTLLARLRPAFRIQSAPATSPRADALPAVHAIEVVRA